MNIIAGSRTLGTRRIDNSISFKKSESLHIIHTPLHEDTYLNPGTKLYII